jgi:Transcriptional regulator
MDTKQSSHSEPERVENIKEQVKHQRRTGGRSARVQAAVFEATLRVLQERSYAATSIAEIAQVAGVHETSIYRRWETKETLLAEALQTYIETAIPIPDTGILRNDLIQVLQALREFFQSALGKVIVQYLVSAGDTPAVIAARQSYWSSRFTAIRDIFARAIQRGEVAATIDIQLLTELLIGPFYVHLLLTNQPLSAEFPTQIVDLILHGIDRA